MKKTIAKYVLRYLFCILPVEIAGIILLPFILPFVGRDKEQLPRFARWFDNHESHLPNNNHTDVDGLLGPTSERIKIGYYIKDVGITPEVFTAKVNPDFGFFKLFLHRYRWIALRNPAYYFKFVVMGFTVKEPVRDLGSALYGTSWFYVTGDIDYLHAETDYFWYVGDKKGYRKGWYFSTVSHQGQEYHELYAVIPYPFFKSRGLRMRIGYKMRNPFTLKPGETIQFETSFTPFKKLNQ